MASEGQRTLTLFVTSGELLRKPATTLQRKRFPEQLSAFRAAAQEDAAAQGFSLLREPVSVELHIHAPELPNQPSLAPVAKAYLDGLEGIAYDNDRRVEHLLVRQDPLAHPMMDGYDPGQNRRVEASVFIEIEPVADYTARYDKAFRMAVLRRGESPWRRTWTLREEVELQNLRRVRDNGPQPPDEHLLAQIRHREHKRLLDGVLADIDRPGPLPAATRAVHRLLPVHRIHWNARRKSGAAFLLPLPGQGPGSSQVWTGELNAELARLGSDMPGLPFSGFTGLDIAVRGQSLKGKDLDNLAYSILSPLEETLCVRRGTVVDYRVYTAHGEPEGVQVRIVDHLRLLGLDIALGTARTHQSFDERLQSWGDRTIARIDEWRRRAEARDRTPRS